ncbi:MAG: cadherin repeat domain-containing protein [Methylococcaceae bacterium]|nr:MAG: cadherin repeat domain-containing protein [Methylococcaceae bacterium]
MADHAVIDAAGNPNPAAATLSLMVDSTAPTLTLSSDDPALNIGEIATLSFMLSEAANDFTADDIAVTGGVLANFAGSGTAYSAQFTPTADSSTPAGIGVAGGAFSDAAGNPNPAANPLNLAVDTLAPTVTLSSSDAYLLYGESAVLSFTLSEAVSDFTVDDIAVTGGSLSRFSGSGVSYSATFTPASDSYFNAAPVSVAAGRCSDAAGNGNLAATPLLMTIFTYPPDTTPPAVTSLAVTSATGLQNNALNAGDVVSVTVTLNEATNVTGTPQLALTIGGATVQADYVSGSGSTALVYSYTIQSGQTDADGIRVAANSLSLNGGTLKDGAGNAATLTHAEVADNASYTVDTEATCTLSAISGGYVNNAEDESSVTVGGTTVGVEDNQTATVHLNGKHYTATVTSNAFSVTVPSADIKALTEGTVTVTADVSDAAGNAAIQASRSFSYDITAPSFTSGTTASVAENTASGTSVYDATADGDAGVTYGLTGVDAAKFTLDTGNGTVSLAFLPNFEAPADSGANNVYDFSVRATDAAGNTTDQAVTLTVTNVAEAGESSIDLGAAYGKLIYPVNVDGKWYYYWDLSGDGTNANTQGSGYTNATDTTTHDVLDSLFTRDINAATGGGDTDNTYRYATLNGVKVALPTVTGAASFSMDAFQPGTPVGNGATPSNGSTATNSTYDDLLAIWDAYNGTMGGTNSNGTPSGWSLTNYWSATPSASGHANVFLYDGYVNDTLDNSSYYVALEVL